MRSRGSPLHAEQASRVGRELNGSSHTRQGSTRVRQSQCRCGDQGPRRPGRRRSRGSPGDLAATSRADRRGRLARGAGERFAGGEGDVEAGELGDALAGGLDEGFLAGPAGEEGVVVIDGAGGSRRLDCALPA